eukprot:gene8388-2859_t
MAEPPRPGRLLWFLAGVVVTFAAKYVQRRARKQLPMRCASPDRIGIESPEPGARYASWEVPSKAEDTAKAEPEKKPEKEEVQEVKKEVVDVRPKCDSGHILICLGLS